MESLFGISLLSVSSARIPDVQREDGQCPSDIEQLLRDYGRAREEARTEIARARERLRERTEQEKRRLQQQVVSKEAKVHLLEKNKPSFLKEPCCSINAQIPTALGLWGFLQLRLSWRKFGEKLFDKGEKKIFLGN